MRKTSFRQFMSILFVAIGLCVFLSHGDSARADQQARITGTYSDMHYIQEAGDILGTEIKIVFTGSKFQAAIQIAEGEPGDLIVVDVVRNKDSIQFALPAESAYEGKFSGTIANGFLRGEFLFKNGGSDKVALKKGKSYWD